VAYGRHASLQLRNILFKIDSLPFNAKAPAMDAAGHVVELAARIGDELSQGWFQLMCIAVVVTVAHREFKRDQRIEDRAPELRQHRQAFAPSRSARGLVARRFKQSIVIAKGRQDIFARRRQIFRGLSAEALENDLKEYSQSQKLLRQPVA
jgi:hypothetical protein